MELVHDGGELARVRDGSNISSSQSPQRNRHTPLIFTGTRNVCLRCLANSLCHK